MVGINWLSTPEHILSVKRKYRNKASYIPNELKIKIFTRDKFSCVMCGSADNLQIDHIISAYRFAIEGRDINKINEESNLQILCGKCNSSKAP